MSLNQPLITIICTAYNHEKFIVQALNSIFNQSYKNIELIIVDNGSKDNTVKTIENWLKDKRNIKFIKNDTNLGITKSFNQASKFSKGVYLMDLSADDIVLPNGIELLINFANKNPQASIVFGNANHIDEEGKFTETYFKLDENQDIIDKSILNLNYKRILEGGVCICSVSALYKRDTFEKLGGYDENLDYEDLDYWIRVSRNYQIKYLNEILVSKRQLSNSISQHFYKKSKLDLNKSTLIILNKTYNINQSKTEHLALLKRVHAFILNNFQIKNYKHTLNALFLKLKIHYKIFLLPNN